MELAIPSWPSRFASVTRAEGEAVRREQEKTLGGCRDCKRCAKLPSLAALQANNPIDGVADALD